MRWERHHPPKRFAHLLDPMALETELQILQQGVHHLLVLSLPHPRENLELRVIHDFLAEIGHGGGKLGSRGRSRRSARGAHFLLVRVRYLRFASGRDKSSILLNDY